VSSAQSSLLALVVSMTIGVAACRGHAANGTSQRDTDTVDSNAAALQSALDTLSDLDGRYDLTDSARVIGIRILGFGLSPRGFRGMDQIGYVSIEDPATGVSHQYGECRDRVTTQDSLNLVCEVGPLGTVSIRGHFLVQRVENGIAVPHKGQDRSVADAVVNVVRGGVIVYSGRHQFFYQGGD